MNNAITPFNTSFSKDYMNYGKQFSNYNIKNNVGNAAYKAPVTRVPPSLTNLINRSYVKSK